MWRGVSRSLGEDVLALIAAQAAARKFRALWVGAGAWPLPLFLDDFDIQAEI